MGLRERIVGFIYNPKKVILLSLILSLLMVVLYACFCIEIYRDVAAWYAYMIREFGRGNWSEAFHPSIPPMNVFLGGLLALAGVEAFTASIIVSGFFYVLTIFPLYALLKRFLKPHEAAWGVLFFVLAPKIIRFSATGMLESGRNFFLVLALLLLFRSIDSRKWFDWCFLGAALAGLAMSRGEGFVVFFVIIAIAAFLLWHDGRYSFAPSALWKIVLPVIIVVFVALVLLSPRLYQNYLATGYPVIDGRMIDYAKILTGNMEITPDISSVGEEKLSSAKRFLELLQGFSRGAYEFYLALAGAGLAVVICRRLWRYEYTVFFAIIVLHLLLYFNVVSSYRYHTFALPLLMPFTIIGLVFAFSWASRLSEGKLVWFNRTYDAAWGMRFKFEIILFIGLCAAFAGQLVNGLEMAFSKKEAAFHKIAAYINENKKAYINEPGRDRVRIFYTRFPEIYFWGDMIPVRCKKAEDFLAVDFDIAIVPSKDTRYLELLKARNDIEPVDQKISSKMLMFKRK